MTKKLKYAGLNATWTTNNNILTNLQSRSCNFDNHIKKKLKQLILQKSNWNILWRLIQNKFNASKKFKMASCFLKILR